MTIPSEYHYIIIGGGIAGSVVASRLHERLPHLSILLIEAGPDVVNNPLVTEIKNAFDVVGSELDWSYSSVPQKHLNNRVSTSVAGKALGGGSAINYFGWVRGDASDYNAWGNLVGDPRWSYDGFLPYFRKIENYHTKDVDTSQHGYEGPMYTQSAASKNGGFPLRKQLFSAWESVGLKFNPDVNSGSPQGICGIVDNLNDGARQIASSVYPLSGVQVLTNTLAASILISSDGTIKTAKGVKLADGRVFTATEEVILSAGAIATPQLLLLSGIGAAEDLTIHGIDQVVNAPEVGKNLHNHMCVSQWWELRHPEEGLAIGSPKFNYKLLEQGFAGDWNVVQTAPHDGLKKALAVDEDGVDDSHPLLSPPRSQTESFMIYAAANEADPVIAADGSHVTITIMSMLPTSRGTVKLASSDPTAAPLFDPNYYATEADRYVMRNALRKMMHVMMNTKDGQAMLKGVETVGQGRSPLSPESSDEEIDKLVRERATGISHSAGTAAMGKVVENNLHVHGVRGLRVVDASIIPLPIAGHIQACVYALAEQAVDIIVGERSN
ncbi:putative glucose dehydrogenase protein [Coleophoma crateriformis]|uniref:Putative glucose dehydrogenase protein n=1 Tax=Coleophoma crateriformis TaxID=565419 RepID=A0A3D8Q9H5_9HELO|nr:putative glucose dehydrogenase protein [Coleophoma crateriformis]